VNRNITVASQNGPQSLVIGRPDEKLPDRYGIDDDEYVSTKHAKITIAGSGWVYIENLGSMNGTYLDERKLTLWDKIELGPGTYNLRVGRTDIDLVIL
jgi:pSer/pThr/pTyr-binding forkhead associated (FHA) protein